MLLDRPLSDQQLLLLMTRSDTEDAPWMTTPDVQWRIIALLMSCACTSGVRPCPGTLPRRCW